MDNSLRKLIPVWVLGMWVIFYLLRQQSIVNDTHFVMLGICFTLCLLVYVNFVYVFNYSYSLCVIVLNLYLLYVYQPPLVPTLVVLAIAAYGVRLYWFVYARYQAASYDGNAQAAKDADEAMPIFVKVFMWIFVSWLMFFHSFVSYFVASKGEVNQLTLAAVLIMLFGLVVETIADNQKQRTKKANPKAFCSEGLYRYCRHPNYLGEIIFIIGLYLVGASIFTSPWEFLAGLPAPAWIVILMLWSAKNADHQQLEKYAGEQAYQDYRASVPSLWPRFR